MDRSASSEPPPPPLGADHGAILGALGIGVVCVLPDSTIALINRRAASALGVDAWRVKGTSCWSSLATLADPRVASVLGATMRDGRERRTRIVLTSAYAERMADLRVSRLENGSLVLELGVSSTWESAPEAALERDVVSTYDEAHALRELARQLAAVSDSATLLRLLCDTVRASCGADGAGVGEVRGSDGVVVMGSGEGTLPTGDVFPIPGSLTERAIRERRLVAEHDYSRADVHLQEWAARERLGELLIAPLFAGDHAIGVLGAWRKRGAPSFSEAARQRLTVIADHASVAVYKARLLEDAKAASLARSKFLATVSHELRTPLTALAGYGELLADEILGPLAPPQRDMVERMRAVTHELSGMIDDILTYSSLQAEREVVRAAEVSPAEILDSALATVEPAARQKGLAFSCEVPERLPTMRTDAQKVRQILVNIAGNAVKFTDSGEVAIALVSRDGEVRFRVSDTGIGIAPEDRARLFQPFTQLDGGLTRRHGGTGLGLYISRRLAELVGGRLELESQPGGGSTFTLVLPEQ